MTYVRSCPYADAWHVRVAACGWSHESAWYGVETPTAADLVVEAILRQAQAQGLKVLPDHRDRLRGLAMGLIHTAHDSHRVHRLGVTLAPDGVSLLTHLSVDDDQVGVLTLDLGAHGRCHYPLPAAVAAHEYRRLDALAREWRAPEHHVRDGTGKTVVVVDLRQLVGVTYHGPDDDTPTRVDLKALAYKDA